MNFDNMNELKGDYYTYAPGVVIVWLSAAVMYFCFLLFAVHFKLFYAIS